MPGETKPSFLVRNIPIYGDLILAPMDGISDRPFRSMVRRLGSAMSYTEFINARDVLEGHPHLWRRISYAEFERPVVFQIFDDDPDRMVRAAHRLEEFQPDIIDVNLGCSARTVTNRGAGAALLRDLRKIASIISQLSKAVSVPITAKIRTGWDDHSLNHVEVAKIIEDNGGQLVAVHGRTKQQGYSGAADWDAIAQVKQAVNIPVIANGDVRTIKDIDRVFRHTKCDAVMIGRAAIGNPWIFARRDIQDVPRRELSAAMLDLYRSMLSYYGEERGITLFRKYAKRILAAVGMSSSDILPIITSTDNQTILNKLALIGEIDQV